jgi:CubicO group peptidase (beta-lactamase class C family)
LTFLQFDCKDSAFSLMQLLRSLRTHTLLAALLLGLAACGDDREPAAQQPPITNDAGAGADGSASDSPPGSDAGAEATDAGPEAADAPSDPAGPSQAHKAKVDALFAPILKDQWTVGAAVGIITAAGREHYGYGTVKLGAAQPPDERTVFEIGSITKTFTGLLLARRVQEGALALDKPVQALLPTKVKVPQRNGKAITLQHLSTHMSGLPRLPDNLNPKDWSNPYADYTTTYLYAFLDNYDLPRDPGESFEYSNLGAGLLGHALALESGAAYAELIRARVTEPLGMKDTGIALSAEQAARFAQGHDGDLGVAPPWDFDVLAAAGALRSTATDMLTWAAGQSALAPTSLSGAMTLTHQPLATVSGTTKIGLGWLISDGRWVWHNGGTGGFETFVGFDLQTKAGVTVLGNTIAVQSPVTMLGRALLRVAAGEDPAPIPLPPTVTVPVSTLAKYAGNYEGTVQGSTFGFSIVLDKDKLLLAIPDQPRYRMWAQADEVFYLRVAEVKITFLAGTGGAYDSLRFEQEGIPAFEAKRVP